MTDWEIVKKAQNGNRDSFELLVDKYKKQMYNLAYRFTHNYTDAQDLSQEIFVQVYLNLNKFNNNAQFSTWLYKLATNKCIDWQRKKKREPHLVQINEEMNEENKQGPENDILQKEKEYFLRETINSLPDKYKTVLILYHFQDLSYSQISEILDIPVKTIATHLYRGKKLLKDKLTAKQEVGCNELSPNRA